MAPHTFEKWASETTNPSQFGAAAASCCLELYPTANLGGAAGLAPICVSGELKGLGGARFAPF